MNAIIPHRFNNVAIEQRDSDGYLNATEMCAANGKSIADYTRMDTTTAYLKTLSLDMGIPVSKIIVTIKGRGDRVRQGTWVHPKVSIHLAQWLSPGFAVSAPRATSTPFLPPQPQIAAR